MQVQVKLYASLREGRFETQVRDYLSGTVVRQIIRGVGLPENDQIIILINGIHAGRDDSLSNGDTVTLLPIVAGG